MTAANDNPHIIAAAAPFDFKRALLAVVGELRAYAISLTSGSAEAADDLVQETLTRAWGAQERFDPASNIRAWTFTILRNVHYATWHKVKRDTEWDSALENQLQASGGQDWHVQFADVFRALTLLPPLQREALILVGAAGWTHEEAAAICNCRPGTIKSRVSRARAALLSLEGEASTPASRRDATRGTEAFAQVLDAIADGRDRWERHCDSGAQSPADGDDAHVLELAYEGPTMGATVRHRV